MLARVGNSSGQGEYYLTDVFALAANDGVPAWAVDCADPLEVEGVNDSWQLARLERAFQLRAARSLCEQGVPRAGVGEGGNERGLGCVCGAVDVTLWRNPWGMPGECCGSGKKCPPCAR